MRPWLAERAALAPHDVALIADGERLGFADLAARADLLARRLAGAGVSAGDRVVSTIEPCVRAVELVHAPQRLGATLVPLNPRLADAETERLRSFVRPTVAIGDPAALDDVPPVPASALREVVPGEDVHSLVFTSGTSGRPKGVLLTHANHAASAAAVCARLRVTREDRWLLCMPLCHVGGLGIVVRSAQAGFGVVLQPRFDPDEFVRLVAAERVTIVSVVAAMLSRVLDVAASRPGSLASLRCVLVGGGPLSDTVRDRAHAAGLPIAQTYGLTEAASAVTCEEPGGASTAGSVGSSVAGAEVRIAHPDPGGVGEILVRGPMVTPGYFDAPEATATALRDGWLHTGDLGRRTADGVLHVAGRRTDLVVTGGENVHPSEVETVLLAHPDVVDAAVYGVPDDVWGQRIEAKVVFRGDAPGAAALASWCAARLARFKVPKAFHAVAALPRTASGKLERAAL